MASDSDQEPWWKTTVVYQVYPRSFCDSDGDGIGDLEGIISKLDYIKELGIETIWFSPFFKSPQKDFGYDISDYRDITPEYGTMATCEKLIKEIHDRKMRIVFDMVLNHTSDQHPWFLESRSSKDNPKRDWYIWRNGKKAGGKAPPNNWRSYITGRGWHYDEASDQWYWAQFLPFQPDLNYRNPAVKAEMFDTVKFWLKKGVDGFRLDLINTIYEDAQFRNNPHTWHLLPSKDISGPVPLFMNPVHSLDQEDTFAFTKELRSLIDQFKPARFLVGEAHGSYNILKRYYGDPDNGLNLVFQFNARNLKMKAKPFKTFVSELEAAFSDPVMPTLVFSNHDILRRISRFGGNLEAAKLNLALQMTTRGVPFIYYGEEIGMEQHRLKIKDSLDAVALQFAKIPQALHDLVRSVAKESVNRDECRTPMQWNAGENASFCPAGTKPWLPITPSFKERNVEVENDDPNSLLSCYKRFLRARQTTAALNAGSFEFLDTGKGPKSLIMYARRYVIPGGVQEAIVILNFSDKQAKVFNTLDDANVLVSTRADYEPIHGSVFLIAPWEGLVITN